MCSRTLLNLVTLNNAHPASAKRLGTGMIRLQNLNKAFRTELTETTALRDVNLDIAAGEFVALTGPSGSGKSTLLNIIGTLDSFDSGDYWFEGKSVKGLGDSALSALRNHNIGFIFQNFNLLQDFTVAENIMLPLRYRGMSSREREQRLRVALERVGLQSRGASFPSQLSGGQQQRVAIARAIAGDPKILLADEPTGNLDSLMARQVMDILQSLNSSGCTLLMVTHDVEQARRARRHIQIIDGNLHDYKLYQTPNDGESNKEVNK